MNRRVESHFLWGSYSPLSSLTGCAIVIMASSRLAFAIFCAGAILWVYTLSSLLYFVPKSVLPSWGKQIIHIFVVSLITSLYLFFGTLINPLLVLGCWFIIILIPVSLISSELLIQLDDVDPSDALIRAALEALSLCLLVIALSLIREPLGFGSLSFPGGRGGLFEIFSSQGRGFFPIRLLSVTSGGFLILGYAIAVYRFFRKSNLGGDK